MRSISTNRSVKTSGRTDFINPVGSMNIKQRSKLIKHINNENEWFYK